MPTRSSYVLVFNTSLSITCCVIGESYLVIWYWQMTKVEENGIKKKLYQQNNSCHCSHGTQSPVVIQRLHCSFTQVLNCTCNVEFCTKTTWLAAATLEVSRDTLNDSPLLTSNHISLKFIALVPIQRHESYPALYYSSNVPVRFIQFFFLSHPQWTIIHFTCDYRLISCVSVNMIKC